MTNYASDQIAAEAWKQITESGASSDPATYIAIIKTAIEKATEELQTDLALTQQMVTIESKRANQAESRAARERWKQDGALVLRESDGALRFEAHSADQAYNAVERHNATLQPDNAAAHTAGAEITNR